MHLTLFSTDYVCLFLLQISSAKVIDDVLNSCKVGTLALIKKCCTAKEYTNVPILLYIITISKKRFSELFSYFLVDVRSS